MTRAKRLILFRRLGPAELRIARLFWRLGVEVRFLEPVGALRSETAVNALRSEGIVWLKASELAGMDAFGPIAAGHRLTINVVDRFFSPEALEKLAGTMPQPANNSSTLRVLLYELVRGYLMPHGLAVTVAGLLRGQGYRVWLWQQDATLLALSRPGFRNLHPSVLSTVAKVGGRLGRRLVCRSRGAQPSVAAPDSCPASESSAPAGTAEVLFFPHQGPYYGDLFAKDQYYTDDPASPLHRSRMCHVELAEEITPQTRAGVAEAYKRAGIPVYWLPPIGGPRIAPRQFASLALRIGPVAAVFGLMLRHRLTVALAYLSVFSKAKLALLGYESLFPRVMAAALQARGIAVAAAQERFVQPFHPGFHLILDHYLMQGERTAQMVRSNPLCRVGNIAITGDLRQPRRSQERRNGPHRCLVLDYHSVASPFADAFAIANSWASNRLFLEDVLRLSKDFPEVNFTIRSKDTHWVKFPAFKELVARVAARPNLTIDEDRSLDRSYALLADSDSVVARHTSLGDQALALGMPVLFHERVVTGERSIAAVMDYSPYLLLTRSYEELHAGFATILRQGHILDPAQVAALRREFYAQPADIDPKEMAARLLRSILAETHKTSCHKIAGATAA